jgi:predicted DNA-binding transcriptional regulator AlpA
VRWKDWIERAGISLKRMSELTGYNKSTLWHAINDTKYRRRLSKKFWGKIGATIRWKVKPLALQLNDEGIVAIRCPHCKTILKVKVGDKTNIEIEPIVPEATKGSKTMSK